MRKLRQVALLQVAQVAPSPGGGWGKGGRGTSRRTKEPTRPDRATFPAPALHRPSSLSRPWLFRSGATRPSSADGRTGSLVAGPTRTAVDALRKRVVVGPGNTAALSQEALGPSIGNEPVSRRPNNNPKSLSVGSLRAPK